MIRMLSIFIVFGQTCNENIYLKGVSIVPGPISDVTIYNVCPKERSGFSFDKQILFRASRNIVQVRYALVVCGENSLRFQKFV